MSDENAIRPGRWRLAATVEAALEILFAGPEDDPLNFHEARSGLPMTVSRIVRADRWPETRKMAVKAGYHHQHRFVLLPSRNNTRWLAPRGEGKAITNALEMYPSFSLRARLYKSFAAGMAVMGWPGRAEDSVLIASKQISAVERLIAEVTGESRPRFALSLGTKVATRKLTVQVMRPSGDVLGYLKFPLAPRASERIRHEAGMLARLNADPRTRNHVPRILYACDWKDGYLLFQAPVLGRPGPARLTSLHENVLHALHAVHSFDIPGPKLVRSVADGLKGVFARLGGDWRELAGDALAAAGRELENCEVRCGLSHGDFAPWNTRVSGESMCLFDWEMASWEAPVHWDRFHFLTQTRSLLRRGTGPEGFEDFTHDKRALYILYLLSSVTHLVDDQAKPSDIAFRKQELRRQLMAITSPDGRGTSFFAERKITA
jgi:phosphotransferase family enzyme